MDYSRPELAERLAAEYVLGTLRGAARRRLETLLPAHPGLRAAVTRWQEGLIPLAASVGPVQPSPAVWRGIERRLFHPGAPAPLHWWQRLGVWQGLAGGALVTALALGFVLTQPPPAQPPMLVVLQANPQAAGEPAMEFAASVSADGSALVLRPVQPMNLAAGRALELWAVPGEGAPRSLGLVSPQDGTSLRRQRLLQGAAALAVSVEPAGGSPTGAPTGPIVSVGRLQL